MSTDITDYSKPYAGGYILFRYLNKQASASSAENSNYTYGGGNVTITAGTSSSVNSAYQTYEQVNFATGINNFYVDDANIYVQSNSETLTIQNARGNYINYGDSNGQVGAYSYFGTNASSISSSVSSSYSSYNTIDERNHRAVYGVLIGGNNANDILYAGSGGSSLWGRLRRQ